MIDVKITLDNSHLRLSEQAWLLVPRPFEDGYNTFTHFDMKDSLEIIETVAHNSKQQAFLIKPKYALAKSHELSYSFKNSQLNKPDWFWHLENNRYSTASKDLKAQIEPFKNSSVPQQETIKQLIQLAASLFDYEHPDQRFNDGHNTVPTLCGTTKGSCVDINTFSIASANYLNIKVQYIAGYWIHPDKTQTHDMHCWLAFNVQGETIYWDLAHHLKWGVKALTSGLNPAGGQ